MTGEILPICLSPDHIFKFPHQFQQTPKKWDISMGMNYKGIMLHTWSPTRLQKVGFDSYAVIIAAVC